MTCLIVHARCWMAVKNGTVAMRAHPDVDLIQGLIGVETLVELRDEYKDLMDIQIVAFPQEGIIKSPGTTDPVSYTHLRAHET